MANACACHHRAQAKGGNAGMQLNMGAPFELSHFCKLEADEACYVSGWLRAPLHRTRAAHQC